MLQEVLIGPQFLEGVLPLVDSAKRSIDIVVFDWRINLERREDPVSKLIYRIQARRKAGVRVRVLVSNEAIGALLRRVGFEVRRVYSKKLLHTKLMLLDSTTAVVGSHNYTLSAFTLNHEVSVVVELHDEENELQQYFNQLWGV